ncbi:MAG: type II toxin-antitoxin system VapC family toxin [Pseudomonadales bacterium]
MSIYVDTSALLKRYLEEPDSDVAQAFLVGDRAWFSGRHTYVEVRRNLARALAGEDLVRIRDVFEADWRRTTIVELDEITCRLAADIGEQTGLRSLDSLHLGSASRLGPDVLSFLTFDVRQAQAARQLGFVVLGV